MTEPTKLLAGKFTLYQTPKGGMHLSLQVDGETEPRHVEIPALMLKMMMRKANKTIDEIPSDFGAQTRSFVMDGITAELEAEVQEEVTG